MNGINRRRPTLESETDAYLRVKVRKGWSERHARGHSRDHTTIMQLEESQKATDDGGRPGSSRFRTKSGDRHGNWVTSPRRTRLKPVAGISHIRLPYWHNLVDVQVWWGRIGDVRRVHILVRNVHRKVRGLFIPHCNAPSSLVYKRREGSLVKGLPILSLKGIPFWSKVIPLSISSRVSNFPFMLLLLLRVDFRDIFGEADVKGGKGG